MAEERQIDARSRTDELKELFELDTSEEIKEMSLGSKRKLAVVTAFMHNPNVLILDEPTSGLDPVMQERFIQFILNEKEKGKTILLSSHIFSEVDATCDRIAIIKDGVVVSMIEADHLKRNTNKAFKVEFSSFDDYEKVLKNTAVTISIKSPNESNMKMNLRDEKVQHVLRE